MLSGSIMLHYCWIIGTCGWKKSPHRYIHILCHTAIELSNRKTHVLGIAFCTFEKINNGGAHAWGQSTLVSVKKSFFTDF